MQHGERERELMIQLSAALRETERLQEALGGAFEDGRAADRRAEAALKALAAARRECEGLRNALIALDGLRDHKGDCARENEYGATCNCGFDDVQEKVERALGAPGDGEEGTR